MGQLAGTITVYNCFASRALLEALVCLTAGSTALRHLVLLVVDGHDLCCTYEKGKVMRNMSYQDKYRQRSEKVQNKPNDIILIRTRDSADPQS